MSGTYNKQSVVIKTIQEYYYKAPLRSSVISVTHACTACLYGLVEERWFVSRGETNMIISIVNLTVREIGFSLDNFASFDRPTLEFHRCDFEAQFLCRSLKMLRTQLEPRLLFGTHTINIISLIHSNALLPSSKLFIRCFRGKCNIIIAFK